MATWRSQVDKRLIESFAGYWLAINFGDRIGEEVQSLRITFTTSSAKACQRVSYSTGCGKTPDDTYVRPCALLVVHFLCSVGYARVLGEFRDVDRSGLFCAMVGASGAAASFNQWFLRKHT